MSTFTASNGVALNLWQDCVGWGMTRLDYGTTVALREFFQAEADERHGRWRWAERPDYVVYDTGDRIEVVVLDESIGYMENVWRGKERPGVYMHDAARAYFEAHPEPKPEWHGAKEGEVWILKTERGFTLPMICQADAFRDHAGMFPLDSDEILEARRIWSPEDES